MAYGPREPLDDSTAARIRALITHHGGLAVAARALALPPSTVSAGGCGAPLAELTRRRIHAALRRLDRGEPALTPRAAELREMSMRRLGLRVIDGGPDAA
jgi:hypothetical protein